MILLDTVDHWARICPKRIAHHHRNETMTYAELAYYSDALAVWLHDHLAERKEAGSLGIPSSPVMVYGHKENTMLVAFLACAKAGHAYIPIDASLPIERVRQIGKASGAEILIATQGIPDGLAELPLLCLDLQPAPATTPTLQPYFSQKPDPAWRVQTDDVYYIIFTSGSTGTPKGVQITLGALESFLQWTVAAYQPQPMQEVYLNQAPFSFDLSVMDLYLALSTGGTLWSLDKEEIANPRELFQSLNASEVSFWVSTPSFAEVCLMDKSFESALLPCLKRFLFCGEVLTHETASKLTSRFPRACVENLYGPTETTVAVTTMTISPEILAQFNPLPVGTVKPDAQVLICSSQQLDEDLAKALRGVSQSRSHQVNLPHPSDSSENTDFSKTSEHSESPNISELPPQEHTLGVVTDLLCLPHPPQSLAEGERGEIVIAGPNVSVGYLHQPEQNRQSFFTWQDASGTVWRAYRTGDAGMLRRGTLFFFGRLDYQVKLHGYRIELGDIEEHLRQCAGVVNAVVLPVEKQGKVDSLAAFLVMESEVAAEDEFPTSQHLKTHLRMRLPEYMIPRRLRFLPSFPMTPNGKVDRQALQGGHNAS